MRTARAVERLPFTVRALGVAGLGHAAPAATALPPVRNLLPQLQGDGAATSVALTFDDGPDPASTPRILARLAELDVRATFFLLGAMLEQAPDVGKQLVDAGHEIAVHGYLHLNLLRRTPGATVRDILRARETIEANTRVQPRYYRPPYGVLTAGALAGARAAGLRPVLWGAWGADWAGTATPESVTKLVLRDLRPGVTILLHDSDCTSSPGSWRSTYGALPAIVDAARARGLSVGPLRDHLASTRSGEANAMPADATRSTATPAPGDVSSA